MINPTVFIDIYWIRHEITTCLFDSIPTHGIWFQLLYNELYIVEKPMLTTLMQGFSSPYEYDNEAIFMKIEPTLSQWLNRNMGFSKLFPMKYFIMKFERNITLRNYLKSRFMWLQYFNTSEHNDNAWFHFRVAELTSAVCESDRTRIRERIIFRTKTTVGWSLAQHEGTSRAG